MGLGPVNVDSGKKVGVTAAQWRTWMLQLTTFLQHQNGSLVDALTLWKKNVDKRFEGVEECYICFLSFMDPPIKCPKWRVPHARKNSILLVFTNGFPLAKIPPVLYARIYSKKKIKKMC